jgi:hypothetical protein
MDATRLSYRPRPLVVGYIEHAMISSRSAAWLLVVPSAFNLFQNAAKNSLFHILLITKHLLLDAS